MKPYPSIQALAKLYQLYEVEIKVSNDNFLAGKKDYPAVLFSFKKQTFQLFVEDEYQDLKIGNQLLSLCLVLRELENYRDAKDYFDWCRECGLEISNTQVKEYYVSLENIYQQISRILGEIDSQISDYDFGLNAGAAQKLREDYK